MKKYQENVEVDSPVNLYYNNYLSTIDKRNQNNSII